MSSDLRIIELLTFSRKAKKILSVAQIARFKEYLLTSPKKGDVIPGTGGLRKIRWSIADKGKRGGARIVYYYHVVGDSIYLLACYAKNEKEDLSPKVRKKLKDIVDIIKRESI